VNEDEARKIALRLVDTGRFTAERRVSLRAELATAEARRYDSQYVFVLASLDAVIANDRGVLLMNPTQWQTLAQSPPRRP
jgi:hypothetical protein